MIGVSVRRRMLPERARAALTAAVLALLMTHVWVSGAEAAGNASYDVKIFVIGAGGARMQGSAGWALDGTIGQPTATVQTGAGGLRLAGGFWQAVSATAVPSDRIFANGFDPPSGNVGGQPR